MKTLAQILFEEKKISQETWKKVDLERLSTGKTEEEILQRENLVSEEELTRAKSILYNIPYVNLGEEAIFPEALSLVSKAVTERFCFLPFSFDKRKNTLALAMADPLDLEAIEFIERKYKVTVLPFIAPRTAIEKALVERYAQGLVEKISAAASEVTPKEKVEIIKEGGIIRQERIAEVVSTLLGLAIKARASDIHLEPEEDKTRVRYRIDGILHEKLVVTKSIHEALVSRIKILSGMKIDEKRVPQDGRFNFKAEGAEVDLRVSSLPTVFGEKIVLRLLKKSGGIPSLAELGLRGRALKNLEEAILRPHGIILICGPTGSGKTTTLYSILSKISTVRVNVVTIEDPVEYQIAGVNQVQVNPAAGLTFASAMRSFLRQDPNIIMVGEIRDRETTELAIQASLTGHLVFSTLHTNTASGAAPRLLDMGAEPFLLVSSLTCVVAQRVMRKICLSCQESFPASPQLAEDIKNVLAKLVGGDEFKLTRGKGCPECNNTGYLGRVGIFEVIPISEKISRLILEHSPAGEIEKQAIEEGMVTMKQDGYLKVLEGQTTIEEVLRVAQD